MFQFVCRSQELIRHHYLWIRRASYFNSLLGTPDHLIQKGGFVRFQHPLWYGTCDFMEVNFQVILLCVWQNVSFHQLTTLLKVCCDLDSNTGPPASIINCATHPCCGRSTTHQSYFVIFKAKLIFPCSFKEGNPKMWFKIFPLIIFPA